MKNKLIVIVIIFATLLFLPLVSCSNSSDSDTTWNVTYGQDLVNNDSSVKTDNDNKSSSNSDSSIEDDDNEQQAQTYPCVCSFCECEVSAENTYCGCCNNLDDGGEYTVKEGYELYVYNSKGYLLKGGTFITSGVVDENGITPSNVFVMRSGSVVTTAVSNNTNTMEKLLNYLNNKCKIYLLEVCTKSSCSCKKCTDDSSGASCVD